MAFITAAIIGGVSALAGGAIAASGARRAARTQSAAAQAGIDEQRRQFEESQKIMAPYVQAGYGSLAGQEALLGLGGPERQQQAISAIEAGPQFAAMQQQGENALLQSASATGGLRGGNIQGALAQYRPRLLSELIQQQFQNLGSLTNFGQAAAAGQATAATNLGQQVSGLMGQQGAAMAGGQVDSANAYGNILTGLSDIYSGYKGATRPSLSRPELAGSYAGGYNQGTPMAGGTYFAPKISLPTPIIGP